MNEKSLWQYFVECFTKKYCCFKGRARRKEFWGFFLFSTIFSIVSCGIGYLLFLLPLLGVSFRRLHDRGKSGGLLIFFYILNLIGFVLQTIAFEEAFGSYRQNFTPLIIWAIYSIFPMVLGIWIMVLFAQDGQKGSNVYGDNPKEQVPEEASND